MYMYSNLLLRLGPHLYPVLYNLSIPVAVVFKKKHPCQLAHSNTSSVPVWTNLSFIHNLTCIIADWRTFPIEGDGWLAIPNDVSELLQSTVWII